MDKQLANREAGSLITDETRARALQIFDAIDAKETTRDEYKVRIGLFFDFTAGRNLDHNSFLEYKRHLAGRGDFAVSTKNKYLATARIFLKELNRQGLLPVDITQNIKGFQQSKKHKREGLDDSEIHTLTEKLVQLPNTPRNARLKAILSLLTLQGLRQVEITRLNVKDLDLASKIAYVQGKGQDDKEPISLHPETVLTLKAYMKANRIADGPLFPSQSNNSRNKRMTTRALRLIVHNLFRELGIEKSVHGFRHFFTTKLIKNYQGDLLEVARYTRHKSLEMLQVYNDNIKREADLPRYYQTFEGVGFK